MRFGLFGPEDFTPPSEPPWRPFTGHLDQIRAGGTGSKGATMTPDEASLSRIVRDDSEQGIEAQIQAKGLTAPRLTPEAIDEQIVAEAYHHFPNSRTTVCMLTLRNGFEVIGSSASVAAENFNPEIGKTVARRKARDAVWEFEGYRLKTHLYRQELMKQADASSEAIDASRARLREEGGARLGANAHGIGPDTDGGPNPDYKGPPL